MIVAKKIRILFGLDDATFYTLLARIWQLVGGAITLLLIVQFLTPEEQGYYFTFHSVMGIQIFIELGFSSVLMQFISHEWPHLSLSPEMEIQGDSQRKDRFISLLRLGSKWFLVVSILVFLICILFGGIFFSLHESQGVDWKHPWLEAVFLFSLLTFFSPYLSILEGCQKVSEVAYMRFLGFLIYNFFGWSALFFGFRLHSIAFSFLGNALVFLFFLFRDHFFIFKLAWGKNPKLGNQVAWKEEVLPMQWRIAITFGAGYILANFFSPVLFFFHGPIEAGKIGLTMAIIQGISSIGMAWLSTKAPLFGQLISQKEIPSLKSLFLKTLKESYFGLLIFGIMGFLGIILLPQIFPKFANRFLPAFPTALLFGYVFLNHFWNCQAVFLRAFKEEPFLFPTLLVSFFIGISDIILGKWFGGNGICFGYFLVTLLALPLPTFIWWKKWTNFPEKICPL